MAHTRAAIDELAGVLELGPHELVSIVGGGGKTTTLFALGAQLGPTVALTTTTKMGSDRVEGYPVAIDPSDEELHRQIATHGRLLIWRDRGSHRADGMSASDCDRWFDARIADHVVVEADGSRRRPFKAPYPYEPVVPNRTTTLLACIGAGALGQPIGDCCHRPDAVVDLVGGSLRDPLTPGAAATVLESERGSRKGLPVGARFIVLVQQVRAEHDELVEELAAALDPATTMVAVDAMESPSPSVS